MIAPAVELEPVVEGQRVIRAGDLEVVLTVGRRDPAAFVFGARVLVAEVRYPGREQRLTLSRSLWVDRDGDPWVEVERCARVVLGLLVGAVSP
jgi:hypothetical protein